MPPSTLEGFVAMPTIPCAEPNPNYDGLCLQCGNGQADCVCRDGFPDDFDPLEEESQDPDWDDYEDCLNGIGE